MLFGAVIAKDMNEKWNEAFQGQYSSVTSAWKQSHLGMVQGVEEAFSDEENRNTKKDFN